MAQTPAVPIPGIAACLSRKDAFPTVEVAFPGGVRVYPEVRYWTPIGFRPLAMDILSAVRDFGRAHRRLPHGHVPPRWRMAGLKFPQARAFC